MASADGNWGVSKAYSAYVKTCQLSKYVDRQRQVCIYYDASSGNYLVGIEYKVGGKFLSDNGKI